ncbi:hypothetical protein NGI46_25625, partial [Peribacillus butanolivorans]|nr:hypothetical protein [Peribacillus butanolivorans]
GKACPRETPQAQRRRGGSLTARGKRVPGVEINVRIFTTPQKNCRQTNKWSSLVHPMELTHPLVEQDSL